MKVKKTIGAIASVMVFASPLMAGEDEVTVYSYRQEFLIKPLLEKFEEKSGYKVNVLYDKKTHIQRIKQEGVNSPADVVLTVDIGRLNTLVESRLVQRINSTKINKLVPAEYRHPNRLWVAQTSRSRVIYASKDRVKDGEVQTYDDLLDPKWKGKICIRDGKNAYNLALWASFIAKRGEGYTKNYLRQLKGQLARKPQGNDRAQVKAIYEGQCDLSLGNTYYMGKMLEASGKDAIQNRWAQSAKIIFPNQDFEGAHMNVSGAAIAKHSPNKKGAVELIEFLISEEAQQIYAEVNHEYPVKPGVEWSSLVKSWGTFKADDLPLQKIADNRQRAIELVNEVNFNELD